MWDVVMLSGAEASLRVFPVVLVKIAPRRSRASARAESRNLAPPVVMLSGAGGGAETSLGERRRTQDARQRESAPPHFYSLTRPDKALGHSRESGILAARELGVPCGRPA